MNEATKGPSQIGLQDLLRAGHVKRWHIVHTATVQTLAEHNYMVATIALSLYNDVVGPDGTVGGVAALLASALFHDATEVRTGDIPTPGKRLIKHFGGDEMFNKIEHYINKEIPLIGHEIERNESTDPFIRMADLIEAAVWIRENWVGTRAEEVARKCWQDMEDFANHMHASSGENWRGAVNNVLEAMLAPRLTSALS